MRAYLWAVGTIVATSLNQFGLAEDNPRQLYVAAAEAIAQSDCPRAIESLEALLASHPDSQLANPAVLHLAECYLMVGQATDAFDLLDRHADDATSREQGRHLELRIHAARSAALQFETEGDLETAIIWANRCFRLQKSSQTAGNRQSEDVLRIFLKDCMNRIQIGEPLEATIENVDKDLRLAAQFALAEHL